MIVPTKIRFDFVIIVANGFGLVSLRINYLDYKCFFGYLTRVNPAINVHTIVDVRLFSRWKIESYTGSWIFPTVCNQHLALRVFDGSQKPISTVRYPWFDDCFSNFQYITQVIEPLLWSATRTSGMWFFFITNLNWTTFQKV